MREAGSYLFPYCLIRLEDGRFIAVNRSYKPLGVQARDWVTYEDHPSAMRLRVAPRDAKKLSWNESESVDRIYLYNDGCVPTDGVKHMKAYLERLAVLMALPVEE